MDGMDERDEAGRARDRGGKRTCHPSKSGATISGGTDARGKSARSRTIKGTAAVWRDTNEKDREYRESVIDA